VAAVEGRNELVPLVLDHPGFDAQAASQGFSQLVLETDQLLRLLRIGINIGRAAFGVSAPKQNATSLDFLEVVGGEGGASLAGQQQDRTNQKNSCARRAPGVTHQGRILTRRGTASTKAAEETLNSRSRRPPPPPASP